MHAVRTTTSRILEAAADLFAERGYNGTTTRAIAEKAGVNEVTIFRRFDNKRGILVALAESWATNMAGFAVSHLPEPTDTPGTLAALAELEVAQSTQVGAAALRLVLDARTTPEVAEIMGGGPGSNFAGLVEYLAQRQDAGDLRTDLDARVMAEAFFALTSQLVMSRQVVDAAGEIYDVPIEEATRQTVEIFLAGVKRGATR
jgi:AcrR family transcriptional regulator